MIVRVRLFAVAKDLAEAETVTVELAEDATVGQLREALGQQVPRLAKILRQVTFAVDRQYASDRTPVRAGSEIACIPPVSGG